MGTSTVLQRVEGFHKNVYMWILEHGQMGWQTGGGALGALGPLRDWRGSHRAVGGARAPAESRRAVVSA